MVHSKFNFRLGLYVLFGVALFSQGFWMVAHPVVRLSRKADYVLFPGILFLAVSMLVLAQLIIATRSVLLTPDRLTIRQFFYSRRISKDLIESIDLFFVAKGRFLERSVREGILIRVKGGKTYMVKSWVHRNIPELKQYLLDHYSEFVVASSLRNPEGSAISAIAGMPAGAQTFSPKFFITGPGLVMILLGIFTLAAVLLNIGVWITRPLLLLLFCIPLGIFYLILGTSCFYFRISDGHLEVRNHLWRWYRRTFRLTDIESILLLNTGRVNGLCVRKFDFVEAVYRSAVLRDRDWDQLKSVLEQRNIVVVDEQDRWQD